MSWEQQEKYMQAIQQQVPGMVQQRQPTQRERLEEQRNILTLKLAATEAAIEALDNNPAVEDVMDKIAKAFQY